MPDEERLRLDFGIDLENMRLLLQAKASKSAITIEEFIQLSLSSGASPEAVKAELLRDLDEGGRIFGEFRNSVRATSNGVIGRMQESAKFAEMINVPKWRWVAILVNTCPDCLKRHGEVKTWEEWGEVGRPKQGHTVCKDLCHCELLPADTTILEPIKRNKR